MAVRPARQGCVVLLMGKLPYLLPQRPALMISLGTAARLRATVVQGANPSSATALEPPSTSAGTDSTDTSFVAADFISKAGKSKIFRSDDWLASSFF